MPETQAASRKHILDRIVETKREEVAALRGRTDELRARAVDAEPARSFTAALDPSTVGVIAEVKRRSPGAGEIRPDLDPIDLAAAYQDAGAAAISVLTDGPWFGGSLEDLAAVRARVSVPLLRKDFTVDELQIHEARAYGADLVLLIVRILGDGELREFRELAESLGMTALVETHDAVELERAIDSGARVVGVNNRDLATFHTDLAVTERMIPRFPRDRVVISESGIRDADDVSRLGAAGVHGVLVGESILRAPAPAVKLAELSGHPRCERG